MRSGTANDRRSCAIFLGPQMCKTGLARFAKILPENKRWSTEKNGSGYRKRNLQILQNQKEQVCLNGERIYYLKPICKATKAVFFLNIGLWEHIPSQFKINWITFALSYFWWFLSCWRRPLKGSGASVFFYDGTCLARLFCTLEGTETRTSNDMAIF